MFDPILVHAYCHLILTGVWFWGWIRHPLPMFAGFFAYLAMTA